MVCGELHMDGQQILDKDLWNLSEVGSFCSPNSPGISLITRHTRPYFLQLPVGGQGLLSPRHLWGTRVMSPKKSTRLKESTQSEIPVRLNHGASYLGSVLSPAAQGTSETTPEKDSSWALPGRHPMILIFLLRAQHYTLTSPQWSRHKDLYSNDSEQILTGSAAMSSDVYSFSREKKRVWERDWKGKQKSACLKHRAAVKIELGTSHMQAHCSNI